MRMTDCMRRPHEDGSLVRHLISFVLVSSGSDGNVANEGKTPPITVSVGEPLSTRMSLSSEKSSSVVQIIVRVQVVPTLR